MFNTPSKQVLEFEDDQFQLLKCLKKHCNSINPIGDSSNSITALCSRIKHTLDTNNNNKGLNKDDLFCLMGDIIIAENYNTSGQLTYKTDMIITRLKHNRRIKQQWFFRGICILSIVLLIIIALLSGFRIREFYGKNKRLSEEKQKYQQLIEYYKSKSGVEKFLYAGFKDEIEENENNIIQTNERIQQCKNELTKKLLLYILPSILLIILFFIIYHWKKNLSYQSTEYYCELLERASKQFCKEVKCFA